MLQCEEEKISLIFFFSSRCSPLVASCSVNVLGFVETLLISRYPVLIIDS